MLLNVSSIGANLEVIGSAHESLLPRSQEEVALQQKLYGKCLVVVVWRVKNCRGDF